jgi:hypothetical protein
MHTALPAPGPFQGSVPATPDAAGFENLTWADGAHAVVTGPQALAAMCALLRQGAASATLLRAGERPESGCADLLIATGIATVEEAAMLAVHAARALLPGGRLLLCLPAERHGAIAAAASRALHLHGFVTAAARAADGTARLTARRTASRA